MEDAVTLEFRHQGPLSETRVQSSDSRELRLISELAGRYRITSIQTLIESARNLAQHDELSLAVVGRFKAGKSSFLNHILGRDVLPIGVVPVTTAVTELTFGPTEIATVQFLNGKTENTPLGEVHRFIDESENPNNGKGVSLVHIELPELAEYRALKFVDLPGLESALAHNTQSVLQWLPQIGLALVAVSVDPPLTQNDLDLIRCVFRYTPHVAILLTKIDVLTGNQLDEVLDFVRSRLQQAFGTALNIYPYSVRTGFDGYRQELIDQLVTPTISQFNVRHASVLNRKTASLIDECRAYLTLALKLAEVEASERQKLTDFITEEKNSLVEVKSELKLITQHAMNSARAAIAKTLDSHRNQITARLIEELMTQLPKWTTSLAVALDHYQHWLTNVLTKAMREVETEERPKLVTPLETLAKQIERTLQNFRDRVSMRTERAFGVSLATHEQELSLKEPETPDVHIGRVFDRNWELLSAVAPMSLVGPLVMRHFSNRLPYMVEKNLSRLASQWEGSIQTAMNELSKEAEQRSYELVQSVERLISSRPDEAPRIRADLQTLDHLRKSFAINAK